VPVADEIADRPADRLVEIIDGAAGEAAMDNLFILDTSRKKN